MRFSATSCQFDAMGIIFMDVGQGGWKIEKSEESQDLHSLILSVCGESPHYQFAVCVLAC